MLGDNLSLPLNRLHVLFLRLRFLFIGNLFHLTLVISHVEGCQLDSLLEHFAHRDSQGCH